MLNKQPRSWVPQHAVASASPGWLNENWVCFVKIIPRSPCVGLSFDSWPRGRGADRRFSKTKPNFFQTKHASNARYPNVGMITRTRMAGCTDRRRLFAEQTVVAQLDVNSYAITKLVFGEIGA